MSRLKQQLRENNLREEFYKNCHSQPQQPSHSQVQNINDESKIVEILLDSPAESVEAFKVS